MIRRALVAAFVLLTAGARAEIPEGTWLIDHKAAVRLFACKDALCGTVVWLRNPALRTPNMCNRTVIWGLQPTGPDAWSNGSFHDPDDGQTYNVSATQISPDEMTANVYPDIPQLGKTVDLLRIKPHSLNGWCR